MCSNTAIISSLRDRKMGLNCVQNREILGGENVEEMMEKQGHSSMYIDKQVLRGEVGIQQATPTYQDLRFVKVICRDCFALKPSVRMLVGWLVRRSVCLKFFNRQGW